LVSCRPTIFYGVPTLYNSLLETHGPGKSDLALRICTSAGEALPADVGRRWSDRFGIDILDGIGATEMLYVFMANRIGEVSYGTTGKPLEGYEVRLLGDDGVAVQPGEVGELHVKGPSAAAGYWCNVEKSRSTFLGHWVRSGDKFRQDDDGRYVFCGRSDDMLKVGGLYVSPLEIEETLQAHPDVLEVAVIGAADPAGLVKPKAFVVLRDSTVDIDDMRARLKAHVKAHLAPYKYPRWIEFMPALPRTTTGKVERYKLRADFAPDSVSLPVGEPYEAAP
jgi:benzoate-CoA ligase